MPPRNTLISSSGWEWCRHNSFVYSLTRLILTKATSEFRCDLSIMTHLHSLLYHTCKRKSQNNSLCLQTFSPLFRRRTKQPALFLQADANRQKNGTEADINSRKICGTSGKEERQANTRSESVQNRVAYFMTQKEAPLRRISSSLAVLSLYSIYLLKLRCIN